MPRRSAWYQLPLQLQDERPNAVRMSRLALEMQDAQWGREYFGARGCWRIVQAYDDKALRIAQAVFNKEPW